MVFVSKQRISLLIEIHMTLLIGSKDLSCYWRSNEQEWIHYSWDVAICFRFLLTFLTDVVISRYVLSTESNTKANNTYRDLD